MHNAEREPTHLLLQFLIGIVDTELFKRVLCVFAEFSRFTTPKALTDLLEMLESVNIQHADKHLSPISGLAILSSQTLVEDRDDPFEEAGIDELGDGVTDNGRLCAVQGDHDLLVTRRYLLLHRPLLEISKGNAQESRRELKGRICVVNDRVRP